MAEVRCGSALLFALSSHGPLSLRAGRERAMPGSHSESRWCGVSASVAGPHSIGEHLCALPAGHDGKHRCDLCDEAFDVEPAAASGQKGEPDA
jgi:hypothetical protein